MQYNQALMQLQLLESMELSAIDFTDKAGATISIGWPMEEGKVWKDSYA